MERLRELYFKFKDNKKIIRTAAVIMLIIAAVLVFELKGNNDTITVKEAADKAAAAAETTTAKETQTVYVDVGGEVRSPGVYKVESGSRVFEAIEKAGGLTDKADTTAINQAEQVKDGQKITIPARNSSSATAVSGGAVSSPGQSMININTADSAGLQEIPGVGPVTAEKIIEYRNQNGAFRQKADIKNVSGIGDKTYAKMKDKITV
jgi:competence protein ComEA